MRIELIPVLIGVVVAVIGACVVYDSAGDPEVGPMRERRRRIRASIDRSGEGIFGAGMVLLGGALIGRDLWRYGTLTVLVGTLLVLWGAWKNFRYLREVLLFRGASRRGRSAERGAEKPPRLRIR